MAKKVLHVIIIASLLTITVILPVLLTAEGLFTSSDLFTLLNTILSWPVATIVVALVFISRFQSSIESLLVNISSMRFPGGLEIQSHIQSPAASSDELRKEDVEIGAEEKSALDNIIRSYIGDNKSTPKEEDLKLLLDEYQEQIRRAKLWKFQYLALFFVQKTKNVLYWFSYSPHTRHEYDLYWSHYIPDPKQRSISLEVLIRNGMLLESNGLIRITQEGRSFLEHIGYIPSPLS